MSDRRIIATWAYLSQLPFQQWSPSEESQSLTKAFGPTGTLQGAQERFDAIQEKTQWASSERGQCIVGRLESFPFSLDEFGWGIADDMYNGFMIVWVKEATPYQLGALMEVAWASGKGIEETQQGLLFFVILVRDLCRVSQIARSARGGATEPPPPPSDERVVTTWVFVSQLPFHQWSQSVEREQLVKAFTPSGTIESARLQYDLLAIQMATAGSPPEEEEFEKVDVAEEVQAPAPSQSSEQRGLMEVIKGFFSEWLWQ